MADVDILIPTCNRLPSLVLTLAGVAGQQAVATRVMVADQSQPAVGDDPVVASLRRILEARGAEVEWHARAPRHGIAEQRDYLLRHARAGAVLYLDDDVFMEPWVLGRLLETLAAQGCGFVGAFPAGLSWRGDHRPHQQVFEPWDGHVEPEVVEPTSQLWERAQLHRAANLHHLEQRLAATPGAPTLYRVAWVASCILYDRAKLEAVGGFAFWDRLPRFHSGEEVLVQNLLLRRWGGCAIAPSGTYSAEVASTVLNPAGGVDGHALDLLPEMVKRYCP